MMTRRTVVAGTPAMAITMSASARGAARAQEAEPNKQVVRAFFELIYQGEAEKAFDQYCAPEYEFCVGARSNERLNAVIPWAGVPLKGREGFLKLIDLLFVRSVDVLRFELGEMIAERDMVVVFGNFRFKAKSTGNEFESDFLAPYWLRDGKILRGRFYEDTFSVADGFRRSGTWEVENADSRRTI